VSSDNESPRGPGDKRYQRDKGEKKDKHARFGTMKKSEGRAEVASNWSACDTEIVVDSRTSEHVVKDLRMFHKKKDKYVRFATLKKSEGSAKVASNLSACDMEIVVDSGASEHVVKDIRMFEKLDDETHHYPDRRWYGSFDEHEGKCSGASHRWCHVSTDERVLYSGVGHEPNVMREA